jgi:CheY-like chemotaxis protein
VDDNATNCRILLEITKDWGMQPTAVESGSAALEAINRATASGGGYRVVIVDSQMPEMDGLQLTERIRQRLGLPSVIVMMMTTVAQRGTIEHCREMGIAAYLAKPIRPSELLSAVLAGLGPTSQGCVPDSVPSPSPRRASAKLRILVAEDNPVNQRVAVRMLEKLGHLPVVAHNGREALSMLDAGAFDLVLMDVQMPEMDGLTATRNIRDKEKPTGVHIPIIAMTAHAMKGDKERCLEAGMDGYISKPVSSQGIADLIAETFKNESRIGASATVPTAQAMPSLWDRTKALERVDGDESLLRELVQIFLDESPKQLAILQKAIATANLKELEEAAHSLKGELSYLGLPEAAQRAKELERLGRERSLQPAADLFPAFHRDLSLVAAAMRDMLEQPQPVDGLTHV